MSVALAVRKSRPHSRNRAGVRRLRLPRFNPSNPLDSFRIRAIQWGFALIASCLLASSASGESAQWLVGEGRLGQFQSLGKVGELTLNQVSLSFDQKRSNANDVFDTLERGLRQRSPSPAPCLYESHLPILPRSRNVPNWATSKQTECNTEEPNREGLIPRISISGSFFSIGYGVELDKNNRGLLIDYGAFTFGVGDSPGGAALFQGASVGLPRWIPGSRLIPRRISEGLKFDLGVTLLFDKDNPGKLRHHAGIGVRLAEW